MRYGKDAPRDIMTWLFLEVMLWGKARGFRWFRLGMAPLSNLDPDNSLFERLGGFIYEHGEHFYNFKGCASTRKNSAPNGAAATSLQRRLRPPRACLAARAPRLVEARPGLRLRSVTAETRRFGTGI